METTEWLRVSKTYIGTASMPLDISHQVLMFLQCCASRNERRQKSLLERRNELSFYENVTSCFLHVSVCAVPLTL
jgi:hypothetical protein